MYVYRTTTTTAIDIIFIIYNTNTNTATTTRWHLQVKKLLNKSNTLIGVCMYIYIILRGMHCSYFSGILVHLQYFCFCGSLSSLCFTGVGSDGGVTRTKYLLLMHSHTHTYRSNVTCAHLFTSLNIHSKQASAHAHTHTHTHTQPHLNKQALHSFTFHPFQPSGRCPHLAATLTAPSTHVPH